MNLIIQTEKRQRRIGTLLTVLVLFCLVMQISLSIFPSLTMFVPGVLLTGSASAALYTLSKREKPAGIGKYQGTDRRWRRRSFALFCLILGTGSVGYWLAYYPGGFNLDAYGQWMQAHGTLPYNNWHPVVSTLLIQLCCWVWDAFPFCIAAQIMLFTISTANLLCILEKQGAPRKLLALLAIYIGFSPSVGLNTICLTKDVQFTILAVNLVSCSIETCETKGQWLKTWPHVWTVIILSVLTILVRHNGVLFVVPLWIALAVCGEKGRKQTVAVALCSIAAVVLIQGPVFSSLQVQPHDNPVGEAVGIPMAVMANALVNDEDHIPEDVHTFLNEIASDKAWRDEYIIGEWDSCKWSFGGVELLQGVSLRDIANFTWKTALTCPETTYESIRENTKIVWDPFHTEAFWIPEEYIAQNDLGIDSNPIPALHGLGEAVKKVSLIPVVSVLIWNSGFQLAVLFFLQLACGSVYTRRWSLVLPLVCYVGGTMLVLAGPNQRYFYCTAVLFLPLALSLLYSKSTREAET